MHFLVFFFVFVLCIVPSFAKIIVEDASFLNATFIPIKLQDIVPLDDLKAFAPVFYTWDVEEDVYVSLTININCSEGCDFGIIQMNATLDKSKLMEPMWQFQDESSQPSISITPFSNPKFQAGQYFLSIESNVDFEPDQSALIVQAYKQE